ncbi:MAG: glycosyltransferase family 2 protein [Acidobacteria bacterium]|nr:glycosyltransferase family 2 protein [Acidobacteriota bacterium]MCI0722913.1 glycosyltransferase family 2 protein [Acidobacteriota bacterium]
MKLIIQIPCFNEEGTLPATLRGLPRQIPGIDKIEVLVINDGSTDATVRRARELGANHIVEFGKNQGLGTAFKTGLDACLKLGADIIVNTDADNQYFGEDIAALVGPILQGEADLVVGTRDIDSIEYFSASKKWLQKFGSWIVRKASGCPIQDTTSGFRAFNREAALRTIVYSKFSYTLETLIHAGSGPLSITNVPVRVNGKLRESRLAGSTWQYLKKSLATLLRVYSMYNPLKVFLFMGGLAFLLGFALGVRYLYFYFSAGAGGHLQSLILAAILMIVGFQIMVIGLVADLIGANRRLNEEVLYRLRKIELQNLPARAETSFEAVRSGRARR